MHKTFPYDSTEPVAAELDLPSGHIDIVPAEPGALDVTLEGLGGSSSGAHEAIERSTVEFDGNRLSVHVPSRLLRETQLLMRLSVPAGSDVVARTASADVAVGVDLGRLDVKTASGDLVVRNVLGDVVTTTASGDVVFGRVTGTLDVRSASGDVRTADVEGEVSVGTASGDVRFGGLGQSARIRTASGDVTIGSARRGEVNVNTVSGDVLVGVAPGTGAWLDLTTTTGDTCCDLSSEPLDEGAAELRLLCRTTTGDIRVVSATTR